MLFKTIRRLDVNLVFAHYIVNFPHIRHCVVAFERRCTIDSFTTF
jgi:hypothetical protein